jgi:hypothetical protein
MKRASAALERCGGAAHRSEDNSYHRGYCPDGQLVRLASFVEEGARPDAGCGGRSSREDRDSPTGDIATVKYGGCFVLAAGIGSRDQVFFAAGVKYRSALFFPAIPQLRGNRANHVLVGPFFAFNFGPVEVNAKTLIGVPAENAFNASVYHVSVSFPFYQ